ncbi:hypothetical protein PV797_16895 [Clostridiaceae bacterium M8S5]|nr:hypothetical protein PV797_16895 [Clostridiaceae bacterium M8S5]
MKGKGIFNKVTIYKILVVFIFISTLLVMRGYNPTFMHYSNGANILDMRFSYVTDDVYNMFHSLENEGRLLYIKLLFVDFLFIISFIYVQSNLLKWIMGKSMIKTKWRFLLSLSYLRALFDIGENTLILFLLNSYPTKLPNLVKVCSFVTSLKFIILALWVIAIPISFYARSHRKVNKTKNWSEII